MSTDTNYTSDEARWEAVQRRDPEADGAFLYGVLTTGIYCRPVCASRQPRRNNVRFFESAAAAEAAGLRPCKRCSPTSTDRHANRQALVVRACELIDNAEEEPTLQELADVIGMSPAHFQRLFKATLGITPKQYAIARRQQRVEQRLQQDPTVTDALYNAGFGSSSRFYAQGVQALGMTPSDYRAGAQGQQIRYASAPCYLGYVLVAASERGICRIAFADDAATLVAQLHATYPQATLDDADPQFAEWVAQVVAFLEAPQSGLQLPLDIQGTAFQQRVWTALQEIPVGTTASYAEIASRIGQPAAVRAVAQACGANKLAVAIPCHRVVRSDGALSGYRWGVERKQALLERETRYKNCFFSDSDECNSRTG